MKKGLITRVTNQEGPISLNFLLKRGCEVPGIKRRSSTFNTSRIEDPHDPSPLGLDKTTPFSQASTSELYGLVQAITPE